MCSHLCVKERVARRKTIYDDPFIRNYIDDLLKNIRTQVPRARPEPPCRLRAHTPSMAEAPPRWALLGGFTIAANQPQPLCVGGAE